MSDKEDTKVTGEPTVKGVAASRPLLSYLTLGAFPSYFASITTVEVTDESFRVIREDPMRRDVTEIPIDNIASVSVNRPLLVRATGLEYESIQIESSGGRTLETIYGLPLEDSQRIQDAISEA